MHLTIHIAKDTDSDIFVIIFISLEGCHTYALNRPGSLEILLAIAVRRKVRLYMWRVTPMWSFQKSGDLPVGFEFERVSCFYAFE